MGGLAGQRGFFRIPASVRALYVAVPACVVSRSRTHCTPRLCALAQEVAVLVDSLQWCSWDPNLAPDPVSGGLVLRRSSAFAGHFHEGSAALQIQRAAFIVD